MDLIYFYPCKNGAPDKIAQNLLSHLMKKKETPFDNITLVGRESDINYLNSNFELPIFSYKELIKKIPKFSLIHLSVTPLLIPNCKLMLYLLGQLNNNKLVCNYHGDIKYEMLTSWKYEKKVNFNYIPSYLSMSYFLKGSDANIVPSNMLKNIFDKKYGGNSVVIPNAIEPSWFEPKKSKNLNLDSELNIFTHGTFYPTKGIDILIKDFAKWKRDAKINAKLYIAGRGKSESYYKELCHSLKIDSNVIFLGYLNEIEIQLYLNTVDLAIYPTQWDSFSLSILEALASARCPVYFSKKAGIFSHESNVNCTLKAFTPALGNIYALLNKYMFLSESEKQEIVSCQQQFSKHFTWDAVVDKYIELYNNILEGCN